MLINNLINNLSLISLLSSLLAVIATAYFFNACTKEEKHEYSPRPSCKEDQDGWNIWNAAKHELESKTIRIFRAFMSFHLLAITSMGTLIALTRNLELPDTEHMVWTWLIYTACIPVIVAWRILSHHSAMYTQKLAKIDDY